MNILHLKNKASRSLAFQKGTERWLSTLPTDDFELICRDHTRLSNTLLLVERFLRAGDYKDAEKIIQRYRELDTALEMIVEDHDIVY